MGNGDDKGPPDLEVYQRALEGSMIVFEIARAFPREERYALTDQVLRSSRSVCANIAETWRKRRYPAAFVSKLSDAEAEVAETQVWIGFAVRCGYLERDTGRDLFRRYDRILSTLAGMITHPETRTIG